MFDLSSHFVAAYHDHFVASRREAARRFRLGQPGPLAGMIAAGAAGLSSLAARIESWAAGSPADVPDAVLPPHRTAH